MITYHATDWATATGLADGSNPISVDRPPKKGFAEFGMGFYCQLSLANAKQWAIMVHGRATVLEIGIPDSQFNALLPLVLDCATANRKRFEIAQSKQGATYRTEHDVIIAPISKRPHLWQQKFQTVKSEILLNGNSVQRRVI